MMRSVFSKDKHRERMKGRQWRINKGERQLDEDLVKGSGDKGEETDLRGIRANRLALSADRSYLAPWEPINVCCTMTEKDNDHLGHREGQKTKTVRNTKIYGRTGRRNSERN